MILIEELGQLYQFIAPVSLWSSYLISYQKREGFFEDTLSILLTLFYIVLKVKSPNINAHLLHSHDLFFVFLLCFCFVSLL